MSYKIGEGKFATSTFDDDLYKINMQAVAFQLYPKAEVKYQYINRGGTKFPKGFDKQLRALISQYDKLEVPKNMREYLESYCPYLSPAFLDFLMHFKLNPDEVGILQEGDDLKITIEGYWYSAIRWEVILMATISELYFDITGQLADIDLPRVDKTAEKATFLATEGINHAEFGTRRRASQASQRFAVSKLKAYGSKYFVGTSNVQMAYENDIRPIGTKAHEFYSFHAAKYGYRIANQMAMDAWIQVFDGNLGIALPDTFTTKVFLESFSTKYAKLYDGVRQDSGDWKEFTDMVVEHYKQLRINPMSKSIVYSDGINSKELCREMADYARGKIGSISLGIGTWITNDIGLSPLNQVIKMIEAKPSNLGRWVPTIKISDSSGKITGDRDEAEIAMKTLNIVIPT